MIGKDVGLIRYSKEVDRANCITHTLGAVLSLGGASLLLSRADSLRHLLSAIIYGLSLIAVYTVSAVYHGLPEGEAKRKARLADHAAVPLLIAGTATPCALITLYDIGPVNCLAVFILAWLCAAFGIISKLFFFEKLKAVTMAVYILSGAVMLLSVVPVVDLIDKTGFSRIIAGCFFYVVGALLCGLGKRYQQLHIIFHIFVMLGSATHFYVIYTYMF